MNYIVFHRGPSAFASGMLTTPDNITQTQYSRVACVSAEGLEDLFRRMNAVDGSSDEYVGIGKLQVRSLSVGDVAIDEAGQGWLCAAAGWQKFDASKWRHGTRSVRERVQCFMATPEYNDKVVNAISALTLGAKEGSKQHTLAQMLGVFLLDVRDRGFLAQNDPLPVINALKALGVEVPE